MIQSYTKNIVSFLAPAVKGMVLFLYPNLPKILKEDGTVAKKKKNALPSGNIRIQVYDYTDVEGKKHYKSFTAPTRQEAKYLAAQWKAGKTEKNRPESHCMRL